MDHSISANRRSFLAGAGAAIVIPSAFARAAPMVESIVVDTRNGRLSGERRFGVSVFKGVPYADTTAEANRFKAPQPVKSWTGVRDATQFGHASPQIRPQPEALFPWRNFSEPLGEDCCVLNVYTPGTTGPACRPVMFYIHGGGHSVGSGASTELEGSKLAHYGDVVVVTINHRLNAFGYTSLSHIDAENFGDAANAGQLDIIAALRWVKENIAAFGGDPGNVTVFGTSGGGSRIMVLLAMPEAKGLFHKAISMSGASGLVIDQASAMQPYVDAFLKELSIGRDNLAAIQEVPFTDLLAARTRAISASGLEGARPVIDGRHVVTQTMSPEGLAIHADVPLLVGHTETEASLFFYADQRNFHLTDTQMRKRLGKAFGIDQNKVASVVDAYRKDVPGITPSAILIATASDVQFTQPLTNAAEIKSRTPGQASVYMYDFAWTIPREGGIFGTPHSLDIEFAFGNIDIAGSTTGPGDGPVEASLNTMTAFVNFARTGKPGGGRIPDWRPYDTTTRETMVLNSVCERLSDRRGNAQLAISDLKIDPFNRAALYKFEA